MLFFFWTGCIYIAALSAVPFVETVRNPNWVPVPTSAVHLVAPVLAPALFDVRSRVSLSFVICVAVGFAISLLFAWHLYLVASNQTSIEYLSNSSAKGRLKLRGLIFRNPYDMGWRRNVAAVFGPAPWYVHMFPGFVRAGGDGHTFETF